MNHQATPGFFLYHNRLSSLSHLYTVFLLVVDYQWYPPFRRCQNYFLSPSTDAGVAFRSVWPDPKRPLLRPFSLGNVNLYFSSHREASPVEQRLFFSFFFAAGCPWILTQYPGDICGKSSVTFPFGAGTARCQVSRLFVFPLNPYGRLWLHVHDTWTYRGVFNHRSNGETVRLPPRGRGRSDQPVGGIRIVSLQYDSELFLPPFSSENWTLR